MDTWGWLALGNKRDGDHEQVDALFGQLHDEGVPRHTSDYVIDELLSLLFRRVDHEGATRFVEGILESAHGGHLKIHRVTAERFREAWVLRKRYQDKPLISFTGLTSFVLIQELKLPRVLTDDDHFEHVDLDVEVVPGAISRQ